MNWRDTTSSMLPIAIRSAERTALPGCGTIYDRPGESGTYAIDEKVHLIDPDPICMESPGARCTIDTTGHGCYRETMTSDHPERKTGATTSQSVSAGTETGHRVDQGRRARPERRTDD